jgi:small subunit ribosomal protein S17
MENTRNLRKERIGVVVSDKMEKPSLWLKSAKKTSHLWKIRQQTSKFYAHDEKNDCNIGDTVKIMETRPFSKKNVGD